jgi:hypothetical protein
MSVSLLSGEKFSLVRYDLLKTLRNVAKFSKKIQEASCAQARLCGLLLNASISTGLVNKN